MEKKEAVRYEASWDPDLEIRICESKEDAMELLQMDDSDAQSFGDGSGYRGGVGAAAVLFMDGEEIEAVRFRLGTDDDHEVYEAEIVGLILSIHLARQRPRIKKLSIWIDNTAAIAATDTASPGPSHYLLDYFHALLVELRASHPGIKVIISWIPGHMGVEGNERADEEAKKAAAGRSSPKRRLPSQLHKPLPKSRTSVVRIFRDKLNAQHNEAWKKSPRYAKFSAIDASDATTASRAYLKLSRYLPRKLLAVLTQLRTGHIPLQRHLHRIKKTDSDTCPCCKRHPETVFHYLMECPAHSTSRARLRRKLAADRWNVRALMTKPELLKHLFQFVDDTKRFHHIMGDLPSWKGEDDE